MWGVQIEPLWFKSKMNDITYWKHGDSNCWFFRMIQSRLARPIIGQFRRVAVLPASASEFRYSVIIVWNANLFYKAARKQSTSRPMSTRATPPTPVRVPKPFPKSGTATRKLSTTSSPRPLPIGWSQRWARLVFIPSSLWAPLVSSQR